MARDFDPDFLLLDRVFQPIADRLAGWCSCFALARACVVGLLLLQTAVIAWDLGWIADPALLTLLIAGAGAEYAVAGAVLRQIGRAERQTRPGLMNVRRITLRPVRLLWLSFGVVTLAMFLISAFRLVDTCIMLVNALWVSTMYFMSCAANPPPWRVVRSLWAFGGA